MKFDDIVSQSWFKVMSMRLQGLVKQSLELYAESMMKPVNSVNDYGYVVFPVAKAYEGFLKEYFYQIGLITENMLKADHFRLGKALNPDLPIKYRDDGWVYDDISHTCGEEVAEVLWQAWKQGRNEVFHYDYMADDGVTLIEAEQKLTTIFGAMELVERCGVYLKQDE